VKKSTTIIIKSCDSADKLFTQKIIIKTVIITTNTLKYWVRS